MSHKTLISGTAYEVVGGAQMIDGTKFQMGGGKTLLDGTAMTIPFIKWHYAIDMTWQVPINGTYTNRQIPTLESPATESSISFGTTVSDVSIPWRTTPLKVQMTPGTLQIQFTGNCNIVKGAGLVNYTVGNDYRSMILTIKASQEGIYTFSFDQINPCPGQSRAYVKVLSFEPA